MRKILELSSQRAKSLEQVYNTVSDVMKNVQAAKESHDQGLTSNTVVDIANQWRQVEVQTAIEKGKKIGYSEACKDITTILSQVLTILDTERNEFQELIGEVAALADANESNLEENSSDPLR